MQRPRVLQLTRRQDVGRMRATDPGLALTIQIVAKRSRRA
jgi:hypothetical protein